jgi:hypothetical protein
VAYELIRVSVAPGLEMLWAPIIVELLISDFLPYAYLGSNIVSIPEFISIASKLISI